MRIAIGIFLLALMFVCQAEEFSEVAFAQQMEANKRVMANGSSYQILKRCGADSETLKKIKIYLYNDINAALKHYPQAKVDIDAVFNRGIEAGDELYEHEKLSKAGCDAYLKQANSYISK